MKMNVKVKLHSLISRAVEEGVTIGWRRAHKVSAAPSEASFKETVCTEVMNSVSEVLDFEDQEELEDRFQKLENKLKQIQQNFAGVASTLRKY